METKHFLDIIDFDTSTLRAILDHAASMKSKGHKSLDHCVDKILLMVFDKPSTRTRVSFDVAMRKLGGQTITLNSADMQLGRGETIADTAKVLSSYGDAIMIRTTDHQNLTELAENASIPVINGLTDLSHPCQIMADILTYEEKCGPIKGKNIAWIGDGNNVSVSWIHAAVRLGFNLSIGCPDELRPPKDVLDWAQKEGGNVNVTSNPSEAASGADCVVTDVWVSMGDNDADKRHKLLAPFQVNDKLMAEAKDNAIFMHCLPAHREDEVTASVIDGPQSVVWDEAANRLHVQKAILAWCLSD